MTELLRDTLAAEVQRHDETVEDISHLFFRRYHRSLDCKDPNFVDIDVEDLCVMDEEPEDDIIAYTPNRIYVAHAVSGGAARVEFESAPRHFQHIDTESDV